VKGFLDRVPPAVQHALVGLLAAVIAYAVANYASWGIDPALTPIIGAFLGVIALWITPVTQEYGVGSSTTPDPTIPADPTIGY
jgi:hypothetical protein